MRSLLSILPEGYAYTHAIATGGIGSGMFFSLAGNETLGREESRMATLLPYKDYCKQHIIMHYISVLLGAESGTFQSYNIGKVGNDDTGRSLIKMMENAGMITDHINISHDRSTLFSVCFQYPDHSGGNITTSESASSDVLPSAIDEFFIDVQPKASKEMIIAAPEVPVETRIQLLKHGRSRAALNIACVQSAEIFAFGELNGFHLTDMLFINLDEARKIGNVDEETNAETTVLTAISKLIAINPELTVFITCGAAGVYCYAGKRLEFFPSITLDVVSTAGAGDAFLAGTIAGVCCGLPLLKNQQENPHLLSTATELGILVASLSVTSRDSIHLGIDGDFLFDFINRSKLECTDLFLKIFS